jgi:hypothetical protein
MKKLLLAIVPAVFFAVSSYADSFNLNFSGGYTSVSFSQLNSSIQSKANSLRAMFPGSSPDVTDLSSGFYVAADVSYMVWPMLMAGLRIESIFTNQGGINFSGSGPDGEGGTISVTDTETYGGSLVPVLLGATYRLDFTDNRLMAKGGVYAGYGFASFSRSVSASLMDNGILEEYETVNENLTGSGFVAEVLLSGCYSFNDAVYLSLDLGYRFANIPQMTYASITGAPVGTPINQGDVVKDTNNNTIAFDYSGLIVGVALSLWF